MHLIEAGAEELLVDFQNEVGEEPFERLCKLLENTSQVFSLLQADKVEVV